MGRREQAKRVPSGTPGVTDPLAGVQDHERHPSLRKVVPSRQALLASSDDHRLEPLRAVAVHPGPPPSIVVGDRRAWPSSRSSPESAKVGTRAYGEKSPRGPEGQTRSCSKAYAVAAEREDRKSVV